MLVKSYEIHQKDVYTESGFNAMSLERPLESDSTVWTIDPMDIMPYRSRIMTGITQISDGSFIRAQFGSRLVV